MGERKVTNKYIPPDFDPAKLARGRKSRNKDKKKRDDVRAMLPFSIQCNACKSYLYRGKKFNSRKEFTGETYIGVKILRLYVKCPTCASQITFKTDPATSDYKMEKGGTRLFEAEKNDQFSGKDAAPEDEKAKKSITDKVDAMEVLEERAKKSKDQMQALEILDQIKQKNKRNDLINTTSILDVIHSTTKRDMEKEIEEDQLDSLEAIKAFGKFKSKVQSQKEYRSGNAGVLQSVQDRHTNPSRSRMISNTATLQLIKKRKVPPSLPSSLGLKKKIKQPAVPPAKVSASQNSVKNGAGALDFLNMMDGSDSDSD